MDKKTNAFSDKYKNFRARHDLAIKAVTTKRFGAVARTGDSEREREREREYQYTAAERDASESKCDPNHSSRKLRPHSCYHIFIN
jgi:hypothetical protein